MRQGTGLRPGARAQRGATLIMALITQFVTCALLVVYLAMLGKIYAQLAGGGAEVSVPSTGN